jgi:hypothetical protein
VLLKVDPESEPVEDEQSQGDKQTGEDAESEN